VKSREWRPGSEKQKIARKECEADNGKGGVKSISMARKE